jgi:hypothetical protein
MDSRPARDLHTAEEWHCRLRDALVRIGTVLASAGLQKLVDEWAFPWAGVVGDYPRQLLTLARESSPNLREQFFDQASARQRRLWQNAEFFDRIRAEVWRFAHRLIGATTPHPTHSVGWLGSVLASREAASSLSDAGDLDEIPGIAALRALAMAWWRRPLGTGTFRRLRFEFALMASRDMDDADTRPLVEMAETLCAHAGTPPLWNPDITPEDAFRAIQLARTTTRSTPPPPASSATVQIPSGTPLTTRNPEGSAGCEDTFSDDSRAVSDDSRAVPEKNETKPRDMQRLKRVERAIRDGKKKRLSQLDSVREFMQVDTKTAHSLLRFYRRHKL